LWRREYANYK